MAAEVELRVLSLLTLMATDAASLVLNTDDAAQSVTHRPLNVAANDVAVTAVFSEEHPNETEERGKGVIRRAMLTVGSSVSTSVKDRWIVSSEQWDTVRVQQDAGGLQVVFLQRVEDELRSGTKSASMV